MPNRNCSEAAVILSNRQRKDKIIIYLLLLTIYTLLKIYMPIDPSSRHEPIGREARWVDVSGHSKGFRIIFGGTYVHPPVKPSTAGRRNPIGLKSR